MLMMDCKLDKPKKLVVKTNLRFNTKLKYFFHKLNIILQYKN